MNVQTEGETQRELAFGIKMFMPSKEQNMKAQKAANTKRYENR